jgi:hypothetical protein
MTLDAISRQYPAPKYHPLLVTEVTRMSRGNYCVAGWDIHEGRMIRPLGQDGSNWRLGTDRSVLAVGNLIDRSSSGVRGTQPPHSNEDTRLTKAPTLLHSFAEDETYALLLGTTHPSIRTAFGLPLIENKYVEEGARCPSLAGIRVRRDRLRFHESFGKLRLIVRDSDGLEYDLPVTCDRLQHLFNPGDAEAEPHFGVEEANEWLAVNSPSTPIILRVGFARPFDGKDKGWSPKRCYLQANGLICPQDNFHVLGAL